MFSSNEIPSDNSPAIPLPEFSSNFRYISLWNTFCHKLLLKIYSCTFASCVSTISSHNECSCLFIPCYAGCSASLRLEDVEWKWIAFFCCFSLKQVLDKAVLMLSPCSILSRHLWKQMFLLRARPHMHVLMLFISLANKTIQMLCSSVFFLSQVLLSQDKNTYSRNVDI